MGWFKRPVLSLSHLKLEVINSVNELILRDGFYYDRHKSVVRSTDF